METASALKPSMSFERLRDKVTHVAHDIHLSGFIGLYRTCPIDTVRAACLNGMETMLKSGGWVGLEEGLPEFRQLLAEVTSLRSDFGGDAVRMAEMFLFREQSHARISWDEEVEYRRWGEEVEYVVALIFKYRSTLRSQDGLTKAVISRTLKEPRAPLYAYVPSLPKLVGEVLELIRPSYLKEDQKGEYSHENWQRTARALTLIVTARDVSFIPQVEKLLGHLKAKRSIPYPARDLDLSEGTHAVIVSRALSILKKERAKTE